MHVSEATIALPCLSSLVSRPSMFSDQELRVWGARAFVKRLAESFFPSSIFA